MAAQALPAGPSSQRPVVSHSTLPELSDPLKISSSTRSYGHQYANIYFIRLVQLRDQVMQRAEQRWKNVQGKPVLLPRILNLQRGQLCFIVGTVYMEMPLKPNVLEELARDQWVPPPAPRPKFFSAQDKIHLEDESGRVSLVGERMRMERDRIGGGFVTGVIMAALGMETAQGDFEVIDLCFAGLPPLEKPPVEMKEDKEDKTWIALASGLSIGAADAPADLRAQLLVEYLIGESGGIEDQNESAGIARLILAGNSLAPTQKSTSTQKRKPTSLTNTPSPTSTLTQILADLTSSGLPIHLCPGEQDPAGATLPQQALPRAMFGAKGLTMETNPAWLELGGRSLLVTSGQTIDDVFKYLPSASRLAMARRTLEWRHVAPTAPDTLWCYPFPDNDPFVLQARPHLYIIGNQPQFETCLVGEPGEQTRIVLLPAFSETGVVAMVCLETLEVRTVCIEAPTWVGEEMVNGIEGDAMDLGE